MTARIAPIMVGRNAPSIEVRFWSRVDKGIGGRGHPPGGCWIWIGYRDRKGYGEISRNGKKTLAHRYSLEVAVGRPLLRKELACHHCDNPPCVNPAHLFVGSESDNQKDSWSKGRHKPQDVAGSKNPAAVLTEDKVREIRRRCSKYVYGAKVALAREYGVSLHTIHEACIGRTWAHVPFEGPIELRPTRATRNSRAA